MVAEALSDITDKVVLSVALSVTESVGAGLESVVNIKTPATGKRIVVVEILHMMLGVPGTTNTKAQFRSVDEEDSATNLTGIITGNPSATSGNPMFITAGYMPDGHFWTAKDESLKVAVINGAGTTKTCVIRGVLQYYEE